MMKMSAGSAVVDALRSEGVTNVFGVIGTAMLDVFDALYGRTDIRYIGVRHEQNGVHMADAYARISGRPGVMLVGQPGPGTTNAMTGIAEARLAYSPVVVIAGDTAIGQVDRDTFQEIAQQPLFTPVAKKTLTVHSAARIPEYVHEAFRISMSGRRGPVVLNIPSDLLGTQIDAAEQSDVSDIAPARPTDAAVERALALMASASRPLIIAGAGVKWARASDRLATLAEKLNCPVAASAGHGDVLPGDHPLFMGQVGRRGNPVATELAANADVILALGTRLGYNTTRFSRDVVSPTARIIQVDVEAAAVGRHFPVALGIVADAGATIDALLVRAAKVGATSWATDARAKRSELLRERADALRSPSSPLHPGAALAAIQRVLPRDAIVTVDTGTISLHATDGIQTFQPPSLLTPLDFGLVAFSFPAGLGAKVAAPTRPVVSIVGDGGFSLALPELATAMQADLATVTVILNNGCWGAEKAYQRDYFAGRYVGADLVNPPFDAVAKAFGAVGVRAETVDAVSGAVEAGLRSRRPTIVDVPVDPDSIESFRRDSFPHRATPVTR